MEAVLHDIAAQVKDGWGPICQFLGVPEPTEPFPRTDQRAEFWDRVTGQI
jgi:hypothetical protein